MLLKVHARWSGTNLCVGGRVQPKHWNCTFPRRVAARLSGSAPHGLSACAMRTSTARGIMRMRSPSKIRKKNGRTLPAPALTSYFGQPDWVLSKVLVEQCGFFCRYPCLNSVAVLAQLMDDITLFSDNYFAVVHIASLFIVEHCGTSLQVDTMSLMSDVTSSKFNVQCKLTQKNQTSYHS